MAKCRYWRNKNWNRTKFWNEKWVQLCQVQTWNKILFQNTIFAMLKQCSVKIHAVVGKWTIREISFILFFSATVILLTYIPSTSIRQSCRRALSEQVTLNALIPLLQWHLMPSSSRTRKCCQATVTCRQLCDIYYPSIRVLLAVKQKPASISM